MPEVVKDPLTGRFVSAQTPPPPPATEQPAKEAAPKPETKEDVDAIRAFSAKALGIKEADLAKPAAEKPKGKPKAKAIPKPVAKPEPPPSASDIAKEVGTAVAESILAAQKPKATEPVKEDEPAISPSERRKLEVMAQMEKNDPAKYKGLRDRYRQGQAKLLEYAATWRKEHPGETFDQEDEQHDAFHESIGVDWDDEDFEDAKDKLRTEQIRAEIKKEYEPKLSELDRQNKLREATPVIAREQTTAAQLFWKLFGEDYADFLTDDGRLNLEKVAKLKEADADALAMRVRAAEQLDAETATLHMIMSGLLAPDDKNPMHTFLSRFAAEQEAKMLANPQEEQLDDKGRSFLPFDKYYKLAKAKREEHWTFSATDLAALRAAQLAEATQEIIRLEEEKFAKKLAARGLVKVEKNGEPDTTPPAEEEETPAPAEGKPQSPVATNTPRLAATKGKGQEAEKSPFETFYQRALR